MRKLPIVIIMLTLTVLGGIYWYRISQPKPLLEAYNVRSLSFFPDGRVVVVSNVPLTDMGFLAVYSPNRTQLWNLTFGKDGTYWDDVLYAKVSPNGKYLGVLTATRAMLYGENGTLLWERKIGSWWRGVGWTSIDFTEDSKYVGFGIRGSESAFYVFSIDGTPVINGTGEGIVGMRLSTKGIYLMEDYLFSAGTLNSRIFYLGFDGTNWSLEFPHGSPRGLDILETPNGTYVAYADCEFGLSLIKDGKMVWNRDNGSCYWDVVFWNGSIYGASNLGVKVYSINGTFLNVFDEKLDIPWTFIKGGKNLLVFNVYMDPNLERWTHVYLLKNGMRELVKIKGCYIGNNISHAKADYRGGWLLFGIYGDKGKLDKVYLIPVRD